MSSNDMFCGDEVPSIVCDLGSGFVKLGDGGQDSPRHVFPSVTGSYINHSSGVTRKSLVGEISLNSSRENIDIHNAINAEQINWNHVETLLEYGVYDCMKIDPEIYPILLSENYFTSTENKEKLFEFIFEKLSVPAGYIAKSGTLCAIASGRPTSLVVDFGATQTRVIPVVDGYVLNKAVMVTNRGGNWIDTQVYKELSSLGYSTVRSRADLITSSKTLATPTNALSATARDFHLSQLLRDIKASLCQVPITADSNLDCSEASAVNSVRDSGPYELPDGTLIQPVDSLCNLPERLLFQPSGRVKQRPDVTLTGSCNLPAHMMQLDVQADSDSIAELVYASVSKADVDVRKVLLSNILLVGGGVLKGSPQRLAADLSAMLPATMKVKVNPMMPIERKYAAWIGGSILSMCGTFQQMWISKAQYEESGLRLLNY